MHNFLGTRGRHRGTACLFTSPSEPITGLAFAPLRVYQPSFGMFLTHDPARQYPSPYAYGPWDPVNGTDPSGAIFGLAKLVVAIVPIVAAAAAGPSMWPGAGDLDAAFQSGGLLLRSSSSSSEIAAAELGIGLCGRGAVAAGARASRRQRQSSNG